MNALFDFRDQCKIIINGNEFLYDKPKDLKNIFKNEIPNEIFVITGPGSYTGVRKALSIAYALSENVYGICVLRDFLKENNSFYVEKNKIVYFLENHNIKIYSLEEFIENFKNNKIIGNIQSKNLDWKYIDCSSNVIFHNLNKFTQKHAEQDYFDKFIW